MGIIRKTPAVEMLLAEFQKGENALSVIELIKRLSSQVNKTTIYRVLDNLEDDGLLHSFLDKNGIKWFATCKGCSEAGHADAHPHFQCEDCGKVDCLPMDIELPKIPNREIRVSQLLIQGKCEMCYN
ncbi:MAG: transcriptional repressor [Bacteroidota bacterium]